MEPSSSKEKNTELILKRVTSIYPVRNPVKWDMRKGIVVISYRKNLKDFERRIQRKIGGPELIRRPLDDMGSRIWLLSDGRRNFAEICTIMDGEFQERIEPVSRRVWAFIETLLQIGLMRLENEPRGKLAQRVPKN